MMILSRVLTEAAAMPDERTEYGMQGFTAAAASFLLTAVMLIPLFAAVKRFDGRSLIAVISGKSRVASGFIGVLLSFLLLVLAAGVGLRAHHYASSTVFDSAPTLYYFLFIGAALLTALVKGLEASVRTGVIVFAGFIFLLLLMTAALNGCIHLDRLYPALIDDRDSFIPQAATELSRNGEVLILAALTDKVRTKASRVLPAYLCGSCAIILFMVFLYNTVFGKLTTRLSFPFYSLSSASDITIMHRINGIDAMVWVMAAILKLALYAFAFRSIIGDAFGEGRPADIAAVCFAALSLILAGISIEHPALIMGASRLLNTGIPLACAAVVVPAAALICGGERSSSPAKPPEEKGA